MDLSPENISNLGKNSDKLIQDELVESDDQNVTNPSNQVPVIKTSPKRECTEAVFLPIKPAPDEDSNSKKMSSEDIETMEILQNKDTEDSKNSWPDTPDTSTQDSTPAVNSNIQDLSVNEDSVSSSTIPTRNTDPILKQGRMFSSIAAADLIEYQWPADDGSEYYMIQEQISTYLGITSFKRKYPEIERRKLDPQEMNHLMLNMLVSEVQLTLGLTAVRSRDVCDLMMREHPEKYQEYVQVLDEKQKESIKNKHLQYSTPTVEKSQMPSYIKKAMKQVSQYNARLNRQRKEDYSVYYDMQTNVLQFPRHKLKKVHPDYTKPSLYPCALIPGQFQEYCQKYSPGELNYFPINTVVYGPPPPPPPDTIDSLVDSESERESQQESMETETAEGECDKSQDEADGGEVAATKKEQDKGPAPADTENADVNGRTESNNDVEKDVNGSISETKNDTEKTAATDGASMNKSDADLSTISYIEDSDIPVCGICLKDDTSNKKGEPEDLISCSQCDNYGHPSCLDMSKELMSVIVTYNWQCLECKTCTYCSKPHHEDKMMFCDRCDRGYHTFCVGLRSLPSGLWMCPQCNRSDPDFAKKSSGGGKRASSGKKKTSKTASTPQETSDTPSKQRRKRRTKKEMEEAREKKEIEKEGKSKKRTEKMGDREDRKKRRRKKEQEGEEKKEKEGEGGVQDDSGAKETLVQTQEETNPGSDDEHDDGDPAHCKEGKPKKRTEKTGDRRKRRQKKEEEGEGGVQDDSGAKETFVQTREEETNPGSDDEQEQKQMEEAREKKDTEKEGKLKRRTEKMGDREDRKKRRQKKEQEGEGGVQDDSGAKDFVLTQEEETNPVSDDEQEHDESVHSKEQGVAEVKDEQPSDSKTGDS